jgi:hypothetical protein
MNERAGRPSPLGVRVGVGVVVAGTLLSVAGCGSAGPPPRWDDARLHLGTEADGSPRAAGHGKFLVAPDEVCRRRADHAPAERRWRSAPAPDALAGLTQPFGGNARRFASLALETFCP